jgi:stage II sporulation protein R
MKKTSILFRSVLAFCLAFVFLLSIDCMIPRDEGKIYDSVIRLHILANSDTEIDQSLKLKVRDAIIAESNGLFEDSEPDKLPLDQMNELGEKFATIANRVIRENGFNYTAAAEWGKESYPTREYDGITFPSGEYYSLRINLGNAEGQNWWCVLFPPLCTNASTAKENLNSMGISKSGTKVYTSKKYVIRFKILEYFKG